MSNQTQHPDILIVGAGMAGLMAANRLQQNGLSVLLVDKGRSVGGRLATRRIGPGRADHGAQFFTVRSPIFQTQVERWLSSGLAYHWSNGWSDGSIDKAKPDGYPRYAIRGGMNALAKHLAQGLPIHVNTRISAVEPAGNGWQATADNGATYTGRMLLLTAPVPQSAALLAAGDTPFSPETKTALEQIVYAPCVAGLFWVDGSVDLPEPGALQRPEAPISWIADNQRKGISPEARLITLHASPDYSRDLWDMSPDTALAEVKAELVPRLGSGATIVEAQLKRWRYALPTKLHADRCLVAANLPPLLFAGDAFGEPRMEGAALSGMAAAQKLVEIDLTTR